MEDHTHHAHHDKHHDTHQAPAPEPTPVAAPAPVAAVAAKKDYSSLYVPGAIVIAGVIIGISLIVAFKGSSGTAATGTQPAAKVNVKDVPITDSDPYIGQKNAPVTIVAWEDYQCPYCKAVEVGHPQIPTKPAMPELVRDYVNTGKVRIVFKDFPFLGDDSKIAAMYEHAIWKLYPEKFFDWRTAMFNAQDEEGDAGFGDEASIIALIKKMGGMDANKLKADVTVNVTAYAKMMDDDKAEASKLGINGTPGFITGKVLIPGAVGIEEFKAAIDPQL